MHKIAIRKEKRAGEVKHFRKRNKALSSLGLGLAPCPGKFIPVNVCESPRLPPSFHDPLLPTVTPQLYITSGTSWVWKKDEANDRAFCLIRKWSEDTTLFQSSCPTALVSQLTLAHGLNGNLWYFLLILQWIVAHYQSLFYYEQEGCFLQYVVEKLCELTVLKFQCIYCNCFCATADEIKRHFIDNLGGI